jgi:hypothetical protein
VKVAPQLACVNQYKSLLERSEKSQAVYCRDFCYPRDLLNCEVTMTVREEHTQHFRSSANVQLSIEIIDSYLLRGLDVSR